MAASAKRDSPGRLRGTARHSPALDKPRDNADIVHFPHFPIFACRLNLNRIDSNAENVNQFVIAPAIESYECLP